ncbi:uncharacterized protein LOC110860694 [Folsomia candida]|uniref:Uncharacterized protein n=1 Tax=Folsomia candida TaxID=158441 RepID=A0A226D4E2_FOLCA|nr:uncharacterized protein LOC110860694 [Folsomia candida]OXA40422.1 hypothetical protein Fcan01_24639 [Folsomia candida]
MKKNSVTAAKVEKKATTSLIILNKHARDTRHNQTVGTTRYFPTNTSSIDAPKNSLFNFNFGVGHHKQQKVLKRVNSTIPPQRPERVNSTISPQRRERVSSTQRPKRVSSTIIPPQRRERVSSTISPQRPKRVSSTIIPPQRRERVSSTIPPQRPERELSDSEEEKPSIWRRRPRQISSSSSSSSDVCVPLLHHKYEISPPQNVKSEDDESDEISEITPSPPQNVKSEDDESNEISEITPSPPQSVKSEADEIEEIVPSTPEPSEHSDTGVPSAHTDVENDEENADMQFRINADEAAFLELRNSAATGNNVEIRASIVNNSVDIKELSDPLLFQESDPGVMVASFGLYENRVTGYINIAPRTLKPMSISKNVQIICWVLKGSVVVRSTQYEVVDGTNYLIGKSLTTGACIVVQPYTPYMMENNDPHEVAVLGYVMISLDEGS